MLVCHCWLTVVIQEAHFLACTVLRHAFAGWLLSCTLMSGRTWAFYHCSEGESLLAVHRPVTDHIVGQLVRSDLVSKI